MAGGEVGGQPRDFIPGVKWGSGVTQMAGTISLQPPIQARSVERAYAETASIPWYIWCCMVSVLSAVVGSAWDISWHETVGRDTFWTPAHMLIYLSGVLAGIACGYLILSTTFQKDSRLRDVSVSMWGFRGPLGAFICAWGAVAMIAAGPFDNWWHNSYGLDVKILSPPHVLLALGMIGIRFGTLVLVLAEMNRAEGIYRRRLERILFLTVVFLMGMTVGIMQEMTNRMLMHGARFYLVMMIGGAHLDSNRRVGFEKSLGGDDHDGDVDGDPPGFCVDPSVVPGGTKAGAGVPERDAFGAAGFSDAADRSSDCF